MSEYIPLYLFSLNEAKEYDEVEQWRKSYSANCDCARVIERAIRDNYKNNILENCINDIVSEYGLDRVNLVLANTMMMVVFLKVTKPGQKNFGFQKMIIVGSL